MQARDASKADVLGHHPLEMHSTSGACNYAQLALVFGALRENATEARKQVADLGPCLLAERIKLACHIALTSAHARSIEEQMYPQAVLDGAVLLFRAR